MLFKNKSKGGLSKLSKTWGFNKKIFTKKFSTDNTLINKKMTKINNNIVWWTRDALLDFGRIYGCTLYAIIKD